MENKNVLILDNREIEQKVQRIAYQILENNYDETEIYLIGIKNNGFLFAQKIYDYLKTITEIKILLHYIKVNKRNPTASDLEYDFSSENLKNKAVILVDDVGNTGRTLTYALTPLLAFLPKKIEIAVLVDRMHKSFPISSDYVGLSLSTTMKEHVIVDMKAAKEAAYLS